MSHPAPQYDPHQHEPSIYKKWEEAGTFAPNPEAIEAGKKPFTIMLPLPNVTGSLHMGHALQHTLSDVLIRYHRMKGEPTLWQPGTDHAGIATQNVVEKELRTEGLTRHDLGREKFLERVWAWQETYGNQIVEQMKRLGATCDWSRFQFTMDRAYVTAVQEAFVRYYKRGYIYRGNRIVNWCPRCASVISDLEIKHEEAATQLVTMRYPLAEGTGSIAVATTRPETMLGDTAVAVHPHDERYASIVGKRVALPIAGREIPIIADERIDRAFATGAVKVTPAHDPLDADIAATHNLLSINVIGEDGRMTPAAGEFAGMEITKARQAIIMKLEGEGLLVSSEPYRHNIARCERCGTAIQPLISRQWFVAMGKLKDETIAVVEKNLVHFHPPRWRKHFLDWMSNVRDWTISRQLWWGQSIPVWWKSGTRGTANEEGNYVVSIHRPAQPAGASGEGWEADPDVLDTWFSSAIWPLVTLGWPKQTKDLQTFYPTSVLATAREILYLWVARMIFSGLDLLQGEEYGHRQPSMRIPFRAVLIHPTVLTRTGQRMSKSLGTGVDPLELVEKYGADATRFGLIYQMSYDSQALKFDEAAIVAARNFANKIWNIARLVDSLPQRSRSSIADAWIAERLRQTAAQVSDLLEQYKAGEASRILYDFVWKDLADWYMEIIKIEGSTKTARQVFEQTLKLLHPFMPYVTEVLWQRLGYDTMLISSPWPDPKPEKVPESDEFTSAMESFRGIVVTIRSARSLLGIKPGSTVAVFTPEPPLPKALAAMARATIIEAPSANARPFPTPGGKVVHIDSEEITAASVANAREKLDQERRQLEEFKSQLQKTLEQMADKAPSARIRMKEVVLKETEHRLAEVANSLKMLDQ